MDRNMYAGGPAKPISRILFDKHDKDNSGTISVKELGELCYEKGHHFTDAELAEAIKIVDKDGSGEVVGRTSHT
jgi:Ca2+-binding EF-hand superfamily protein